MLVLYHVICNRVEIEAVHLYIHHSIVIIYVNKEPGEFFLFSHIVHFLFTYIIYTLKCKLTVNIKNAKQVRCFVQDSRRLFSELIIAKRNNKRRALLLVKF
jgi:hypothetical protein